MKEARESCAMCRHFTTAAYPTEARYGVGRCVGFDMPGHAERFVAAVEPSCVIFGAAANPAPRRAFLMKFQEVV